MEEGKYESCQSGRMKRKQGYKRGKRNSRKTKSKRERTERRKWGKEENIS